MAFDSFTLAIIILGAGTVFGALNSVFGWLKSNAPFEPRKFAITVLTGIGAALVLTFAQLSGIVDVAQTNFDLLYALGGLAFAIFGVNFVRTVGSALVAQRAETEVKSE
jgi:hypothetical protein